MNNAGYNLVGAVEETSIEQALSRETELATKAFMAGKTVTNASLAIAPNTDANDPPGHQVYGGVRSPERVEPLHQ